MNNSNQGFTLIELVISILIISIIATVTIPGIVAYQNKQAEDTFVNQYINQLRSLQNISLTKDRLTKTVYDSTSKVINFCESEDCSIVKSLKIPNIIDTANANFLTFYFDKYGNVLDNTKTSITEALNIQTNLYQIVLNPYGGISKETVPATETILSQ